MKQCPKCKSQFEDSRQFCITDGERLVSQESSQSTVDSDADPWIGFVIEGKYRLVRRIGGGGMGVVYEARHTRFDKQSAVKLMKLPSDPVLTERFKLEARTAALMKHPYIVPVYDFGEMADGSLYMVMEYVDGKSLRHVLQGEKLLAPERVVKLVGQICAAVAAAHNAKVVHRDLKPENVMIEIVDGEEMARLLDFGIAKLKDEAQRLTKTNQVVGTPYYMSPEQCNQGEVDHLSDIYSIGVMLYEMLSGHLPFGACGWPSILVKQATEKPRPLREVRPELPEPLVQVVMKALEKEPSCRQQTTTDLASELKAALPVPPPPTEVPTMHIVKDDEDADIFISYSSEDTNRVLEITGDLEALGVRVWIARQKITGGGFYGPEIVRAIKSCKAMVLMCSDASMRSRDVKQEILLAWKYEKPYLPLMLQKTSYPEQLEYWLEGWYWVEVLDLPKQEWLPRVFDVLAQVGVSLKGDTGQVSTRSKPAYRGLGGLDKKSTSSSGRIIEPVYQGGGLEGLRAIACFTDQIWPVSADRVRTTRSAFRGLGAPQDDVQHIYKLGRRVHLVIESELEGHLLLIDEGPEEKVYCLCPSWFAPSTRLSKGRSYLPQSGARYESFLVTGEPGREHLLAIITDEPLNLDWMPDDPKTPARILDQADINELLNRLRALEVSKWTALSTYFDVIS